MCCRWGPGSKVPRRTAQVVAIRAGRFFDARSGNVLNDQIVLV